MKRFRTKFCSEQIGNVSEIKLIALCLVFSFFYFKHYVKKVSLKGRTGKAVMDYSNI